MRKNSVFLVSALLVVEIAHAQIFKTTPSYTIPSTGAQMVRLADLNGDGYLDAGYACGNFSGGIDTSFLVLNNKSGIFDSLNLTKILITNSLALAFGDVDKDGDEDVAFAGDNNNNACNSKLFLNDGTGSFPDTFCFSNSRSGDVKIVDLNNDSWKDIVFANYESLTGPGHAKIFWNQGAGVFNEDSVSLLPVEHAKAVLYNDYNKDGKTDLLFLSYRSDTIALPYRSYSVLFRNTGGKNFDTTSITKFYAVGAWTGVFDDINNDTWPDIIIFNSYDGTTSDLEADVYYNDGAGLFSSTPDTSFPCYDIFDAQIADMNNDGYKDLITANADWTTGLPTPTNNYIFYFNSSSSSLDFVSPLVLKPIFVSSVTVGDLDNDDDNDIVFARLLNTSTTDYSKTQSPIFLNQKFSPPEFQFNVMAGFNSAPSKSLRLGWDAKATNGVDSIFNEKNISPASPDINLEMTPAAAISKIDIKQKRFSKNIWKIQIDALPINFPLTLKWDKTELIGKGNFYLRDKVNSPAQNFFINNLDSVVFSSPIADLYIVQLQDSIADFEADISIWTSNGKNDMLQFGWDNMATNGIDTVLGEVDLPPPPPGNNFDARLMLPNQVQSSKRDIRDTSSAGISWLLRWQCLNSEYPVTIRWDSVSLQPLGGCSWIIKDNINGTIYNERMDSVSSMVITNTGVSELKIEYCVPLGIEEQYFSPRLTIYPNPFDNELSILYKNFYEKNIQMEICDVFGREIWREEFSLSFSGMQHIFLENLPSGIYFLRIQSEKYQRVEKLIKY